MEDATWQELISKGWREGGRWRVVHGEHIVTGRGGRHNGGTEVMLLLFTRETSGEDKLCSQQINTLFTSLPSACPFHQEMHTYQDQFLRTLTNTCGQFRAALFCPSCVPPDQVGANKFV